MRLTHSPSKPHFSHRESLLRPLPNSGWGPGSHRSPVRPIKSAKIYRRVIEKLTYINRLTSKLLNPMEYPRLSIIIILLVLSFILIILLKMLNFSAFVSFNLLFALLKLFTFIRLCLHHHKLRGG